MWAGGRRFTDRPDGIARSMRYIETQCSTAVMVSFLLYNKEYNAR